MLHHLKSLEGPNPADDDPSLLAPEEQDTESPAEDAEAAPVEVVNENSNVVDPEQERLAKERGEDLIREIEQEYVKLQAKRQRKAKRVSAVLNLMRTYSLMQFFFGSARQVDSSQSLSLPNRWPQPPVTQANSARAR